MTKTNKTTMTIAYILITLLSVAVAMLAWRLYAIDMKMQGISYSVRSSLGIAMAVTLDAQMDKLNKMKRKAKQLIKSEQYEEAMEMKAEILKLSKYIQNAVDSYNEHAGGGLRIGFNDENENEYHNKNKQND